MAKRRERKTIREHREERGWTQFDLAQKAGATPSSVYNWETGRFEPSASKLRDLAAALGVLMDDIELVPPIKPKKGGDEPKKWAA